MKSNKQIQEFHSKEFGALDILLIGGKPYFPATECAAILGYNQPEHAVKRHCAGDGCTKRTVIDRLGREQEKTYISEGNLYRLIIRSKLPAAERFEKWVFDEVLPTIRKHGAYAAPETLDEMLRSPEFAAALTRKLDAERKKSAALMELAEEMAPKALYCDIILQCKNVVPVSLIAKDYGMSAAAFNSLLHNLGIQYRIAGCWLLYQDYAAQGYTKTRTYHVGENTAAMHTCWTQKGRVFLYKTLKAWGIVPMSERPAAANWGGRGNG
jgi:prophage antirepressor-like protein